MGSIKLLGWVIFNQLLVALFLFQERTLGKGNQGSQWLFLSIILLRELNSGRSVMTILMKILSTRLMFIH